MRSLATPALLGLIACICVLPAYADTILTSSNASTANNTSPAVPTVDLTATGEAYGGWANIPGADWISIADTGNSVVEPDGTAVTFTDTFDLASLPSSALLEVLADDTASVTVNGTLVWGASSGPFPFCSTPVIGCTHASEGMFDVLSDLAVGSNTLAFTAYQEAGGPYGLDFALVEQTSTPPVPEPGTLLMLGLSLIALVGLIPGGRLRNGLRICAGLCAAILCCGFVAQAQTDNWNGGAGNWSVPSNWSAGLPVSTSMVGISATSNPVASSVLLDINATISSVGIDPTSSLTLGSGNTLNVTGPGGVSDAGQLTLDSGSTLNVAGAGALNSGFGQLTLDSGSTATISQPADTSLNITVNSGGTMNTGALTFESLGSASINGTLNSGALTINQTSLTIGAGGVVNSGAIGTLSASISNNGGTLNSGALQIDGTFSQTGATSTTVINGDLSTEESFAISGGSVTVNGDISSAPNESNGSGISVSSGSVLKVTGTFNNNPNLGNGEFASGVGISGGSKVMVGGDFNNVSLNYINFSGPPSGVGDTGLSITGASVLSVGGNFNNDAGVQTPADLLLQGGSVLNIAGDLNNTRGVFESQPGVFDYTPSTVTLQQGSVISVQGSVMNQGTISIDSTSALSTHSGFTQTAGSTVVDGILSVSGTGVNIQGGSLSGTGTINGNVTNGGTVMPGDAPGTLSITGNYSQMSAGTFMEEIASAGPGGFSVLDVSGTASLDGTLDIDLLNGFTPTLGESFTIMDFASLSGAFSTVDGLDIGDGLQFDLFYDPTDVRLVVESATATPEPSTFLLLGAGLVTLLGWHRKSMA